MRRRNERGHGRPPAEAIHFAAAAIERRAADSPGLNDDLALLNIFGELAFPHLDVGGIIGRDKMKGSKLIRSFVAEARREDVAEALRIRFGEAAGMEILPLLERIEDPERLGVLHALAIRSSSLDEFRAGMAAPPPPRSRARSRRS